MPPPDLLRFTPRAPRQRSEAPHTAVLAYVDIPLPDPELAVSVVDVAAGTVENARSRAVSIVYEAETESVTVTREGDTAHSFTEIGTRSVVGVLNGLRWDMPCTLSIDGNVCKSIDPPVIKTLIAGPIGETYEVTLRFRGVIETRDYPGVQTFDGNYWSEGLDAESPANPDNIYRLDISDPPQVFYLNTSSVSHPQNTSVYAVDYTKTVTMNANSFISMTAKGVDGIESTNLSVQVPGLSYQDGQFLQMNVVSVSSNTGALAIPPPLKQQALVSPIRVLRVEEDPAGGWSPVLTRGLFYRMWRMDASEGANSWLRTAGFFEGQYLLLTYSTELDWSNQNGSALWTGSGASGGGGRWCPQTPASLTLSSRTVSLFPSGLPSSVPRLLALGGLKTDNGTELLAETPRFSNGTLQPCGKESVNNQTYSTWVECFPMAGQSDLSGRTRGDRPLGEGLIPDWELETPSAASLLAALRVSASANSVVFRFSGAVYVETEGFYTFSASHAGKLRLFHWALPVIDQWYGPTRTSTVTDVYSPYLHKGWHDYTAEWAPDSPGDTFALGHSGDVWWGSAPTTRSQVRSIDAQTGTLTLLQGYIAGGNSNSSPSLSASYAFESAGLSFRGYIDDSSTYQGLDLNPARGRFSGGVPSKDWALHSSCWLYAVPSLACALTDQNGVPYNTGHRDWKSCVNHGVRGTIRWGRVSNREALNPGVSGQSSFAASSRLEDAILGQSVYSSSPQSTGLSPEHDPRGAYSSASVFAHLNVVAGTPDLNTVRVFDVRTRGGGLSHETSPQALPTGGPRERTETNWDLSPWDGYDGPVSGVALYEIPQEVLDGSGGGPIFTVEEVEALIHSTAPAGIRAVIIYTE